MILLTSNSLTQVKLIDAVEMDLNIRERDSTASISVESTDGISVNSWMKDDDSGPGNGMIWRVKSIRQNFGKGFPEIDLEHIICTLKDRILFGEITPATITGDDEATTCTAQQAIAYILNQQSDWTLGTFSYGSVSSAYRFDGDNLFDALKKVSDTFDEPWWSYDLSVYPFRLNITAKPSGVGCEMRAGRNLETISRTIDKTGMYTRFYPIGKDDLHVSGNYVSKNEATYGVISKVETDQSIDTEAGLTAWANERLNKHAQPRVNITVNGLALADATGETLDSLTLGRICRVPLPEYGTTIEERITELNYQDALNKPESVTVTLSNEKDDRTTFAALISNEIKNGGGPSGGGARTAARQQKEDHAWFEDTDEHVAMVAESIIGVDADGNPNWTRLSSFIVDGQGIHGDVHTLVDGVLTNQATLDITENRVSVVVDADGNVKPASIVAGINGQSGSFVKISADKINLDGYVTTSMLESAFTSAQQIATEQMTISQYFTCLNYNVTWQTKTIGGTTIYYLGR